LGAQKGFYRRPRFLTLLLFQQGDDRFLFGYVAWAYRESFHDVLSGAMRSQIGDGCGFGRDLHLLPSVYRRNGASLRARVPYKSLSGISLILSIFFKYLFLFFLVQLFITLGILLAYAVG